MIALVAALVGGVYVLSSTGNKRTIVGYFTSAVGLYPGDQVRVLGVPVGEIDMIEPRSSDVKITMSVSKDVKVPVDVQAVIMSPNLVAARFIQLTPVYTGGRYCPTTVGSIWIAPRCGGMGRGEGAHPVGRRPESGGGRAAGAAGRGDQPGRGHP